MIGINRSPKARINRLSELNEELRKTIECIERSEMRIIELVGGKPQRFNNERDNEEQIVAINSKSKEKLLKQIESLTRKLANVSISSLDV